MFKYTIYKDHICLKETLNLKGLFMFVEIQWIESAELGRFCSDLILIWVKPMDFISAGEETSITHRHFLPK